MRFSQSSCEDADFAVARAPGTVVLLAWCAAATHFDTSSAMRPFWIFSGFVMEKILPVSRLDK